MSIYFCNTCYRENACLNWKKHFSYLYEWLHLLSILLYRYSYVNHFTIYIFLKISFSPCHVSFIRGWKSSNAHLQLISAGIWIYGTIKLFRNIGGENQYLNDNVCFSACLQNESNTECDNFINKLICKILNRFFTIYHKFKATKQSYWYILSSL